MKKQCSAPGHLALLLLATLSLGAASVSAAEIACEYDTNGEWPQPVGKVCQSQEPSQTPPLLANDDSSAWVTHCSDSSFDTDGDGWGWENHASCKVVGTSVQKTNSVTCKSSASDSDGDGWGWENNASCKAISASAQQIKTAACESSASDSDGDGWGWENGASCQVSNTTTDTGTTKSGTTNSNTPDNSSSYKNTVDSSAADKNSTNNKTNGVVFEQNFEAAPLGRYGSDQLNADWKTPIWHLGFVQGRVDVVSDPERGNAIMVKYPANKYGAAGAAAFLSDVELGVNLPKSYDELYLSYDVKFAKGFDFVRGGKLPGLCGYDNTLSPTSGCNTGGGFPDGYDGWSARGMWREDGKLENYVYHAAQTYHYGDDEYWNVNATAGKWHTIQHRVVMNTPGVANGVMEAWLDGNKVLSGNKFMFRKSANIGINLFYFSTFYGGNDSSWAPTEDQFVYFDNFRISTNAELPDSSGILSSDSSQPGNSGELSLNDESTKAEQAKTSTGGGTASFFTIFLLLLLRLKVDATNREK